MKLDLRLVILLGGVGIGAAGCHNNEPLGSQGGGHCGPTPQLLVGAASYWPADAGAGTPGLLGMAVDGPDLYFTVDVDTVPPVSILPGALMRVSTGGGPVTVLASGYQFQTPLVTSTSVIVGVIDASTYLGGVLSVPRNGAVPAALVSFDDTLIRPPVTDGNLVYLVDNGGLQSVPLSVGASPATPTTLAREQPVGLAVVGQRLLFQIQNEIHQIPVGAGDAGAETVLASGLGDWVVQTLIPCGANGCYLSSDAIRQIDPSTGVVSTLAGLSSGAAAAPYLSIAFDGTDFFVLASSGPTSSDTATIERISAQGGAPVTVATLTSSSSTLEGFAAADGCVYFASATGIYSLSGSAQGVSVP